MLTRSLSHGIMIEFPHITPNDKVGKSEKNKKEDKWVYVVGESR